MYYIIKGRRNSLYRKFLDFKHTRFMFYLFRWQLSTPILYGVLVMCNPVIGSMSSTILANLIGGCFFFFIDRKRQHLAGVQHIDSFSVNLNLARGEIRISGIFKTRSYFADYLKHPFISDVDVPFDIIHSPNNAYEYRVHMSKSILSKILAELPSKINYSNFKNSIPKEDIMLKDFASRVWNAGFVTLKESAVEFFKLVNQRRRESELNTP